MIFQLYTGKSYVLKVYTEHSVQQRSSGSTAAAYIGLEDAEGNMYWGAGTDTDIIKASAHALISAYNNMTRDEAYALLVNTVNKESYASAVESYRASHNIKMSQAQFDALVSFVYNLGAGNLNTSFDTFKVMLNATDPTGISSSNKASTRWAWAFTFSGAGPPRTFRPPTHFSREMA